MSDTPRTDAAESECACTVNGSIVNGVVTAWFARQLERDLNRLQAIFDAATEIQGDDEVLKYVRSGNAIPVTRCTVSADLIRQLLSARAEPLTFDDGIRLTMKAIATFQVGLKNKGETGAAVAEFLTGLANNIHLLAEAEKLERTGPHSMRSKEE